MTKVRLKENLRYFEADDTDFNIKAKEIKELPEKYLRSYSIKHHLFHGLFEIVEGEFTYHMKSALIYVAENVLYAKEYGRYFTKDLELDTITFITEDQVPKNIIIKLNPNTSVDLIEPEEGEDEDEPDGQEEDSTEEIEPEVEESTSEEVDGETDTEESKEEEVEEVNFDKMTKDQLNDYAAIHGFSKEITYSMRVGEMREKLRELIKK